MERGGESRSRPRERMELSRNRRVVGRLRRKRATCIAFSTSSRKESCRNERLVPSGAVGSPEDLVDAVNERRRFLFHCVDAKTDGARRVSTARMAFTRTAGSYIQESQRIQQRQPTTTAQIEEDCDSGVRDSRAATSGICRSGDPRPLRLLYLQQCKFPRPGCRRARRDRSGTLDAWEQPRWLGANNNGRYITQ